MRSIFNITTITLFLFAAGSASGAEQKVVDPSGKTIGLVIDCSSCKDESAGESCNGGVAEGFHNGKRCGSCLMESNYGRKMLSAYDLQMTGTLQEPGGSPLGDEFLRLFLPNSWTVRTRSTDKGFFRVMLGATLDRQGDKISVDLGSRTRAKGAAADYALYMVPPDYKPCQPVK